MPYHASFLRGQEVSHLTTVAEKERFELSNAFTRYTISSRALCVQALCHVGGDSLRDLTPGGVQIRAVHVSVCVGGDAKVCMT